MAAESIHSPDFTTRRKAAVAVVVHPGQSGDELLVLRRATFAGDPWSGHIALPGGREEPYDESLEVTARRETLEETGIDLSESECQMQLGTVVPQSIDVPTISVAPFVFDHSGATEVRLSAEIVEAWWVPVSDFAVASLWSEVPIVTSAGRELHVRAFQIHGYPLWGLTERVLKEFLDWKRSLRRY